MGEINESVVTELSRRHIAIPSAKEIDRTKARLDWPAVTLTTKNLTLLYLFEHFSKRKELLLTFVLSYENLMTILARKNKKFYML